ncbi:hypothetical protein SFUMM280S_04825 [Streptomyces fumanus]
MNSGVVPPNAATAKLKPMPITTYRTAVGNSAGSVAALGAAKQASSVDSSSTPRTGPAVPPALSSRKAGTASTIIAAAPPAYSKPTTPVAEPAEEGDQHHDPQHPMAPSTSAKLLEQPSVWVSYVGR